MSVITMKQMLETGVHFGHQTKRWNPKMRKYIYGERNGIHILNLEKTVDIIENEVYPFIVEQAKLGKNILFVGTKKQAQDAIKEEAERCGMFYVNSRWLGGTLTNFKTIRSRVDRLNKLNNMERMGEFDLLPKKEVAKLKIERDKLELNLGGIKDMRGLPGVMFIVDPDQEDIAVMEARKLHIPIVAITDTNCDPDLIDYVIPANDDAIRAIKLIAAVIADAVIEANQGIQINRGDMEDGAVDTSFKDAIEKSIKEMPKDKEKSNIDKPATVKKTTPVVVNVDKDDKVKDKVVQKEIPEEGKKNFGGGDVVALRAKTGAGVLDCKKALMEANGDMDKAIDLLREKGMATAAKKADRIAAEGIVDAMVKGNTGVLVEVNCETDFVAKGDQYKAFVDSVAEYVCDNEVKDADALIEAKKDDTVAATAKIGEKIAIRRFEKFVTESGVIETYIHMGGKVGVMVEVAGCDCEGTHSLAHDLALQIAASKPLYLCATEVPNEVLEHEKEILKAQALNEGKPAAIIDKMVEGRVKKYYDEFCLLNQAFVKDPSVTIEKLVKDFGEKVGKEIVVKRFVRFEMGEGLEKRNDNFAEEVAAQMKK